MAEVTISRSDLFPVGTSVSAYLHPGPQDAVSNPGGPAVATATVASDGTLTFTGLEEDVTYTAYATVSGERRLCRVASSKPKAEASPGTGSSVTHPAGIFPVGTSVGLYARAAGHPLGKPSGAALATATVESDGSLTFPSLEKGVAYLAYAEVSGVSRYLQIGA